MDQLTCVNKALKQTCYLSLDGYQPQRPCTVFNESADIHCVKGALNYYCNTEACDCSHAHNMYVYKFRVITAEYIWKCVYMFNTQTHSKQVSNRTDLDTGLHTTHLFVMGKYSADFIEDGAGKTQTHPSTWSTVLQLLQNQTYFSHSWQAKRTPPFPQNIWPQRSLEML